MDSGPARNSRVQDIATAKVMDKSACRKGLTTYAAYNLRRCPPQEPRREGKGTWARAEVVKEKSAQEDIIKQIKKLNDKGRSMADKKRTLSQYQQGQLIVLLNELTAKERDRSFEWSLVQLDCVKKPIYSKSTPAQVDGVAKPANSKPSGGKQLFDTISITAFVMRAPRKDLDPIMLWRNIEDRKFRPPPPPLGQTPAFNGDRPFPPPPIQPLGSLSNLPPPPPPLGQTPEFNRDRPFPPPPIQPLGSSRGPPPPPPSSLPQQPQDEGKRTVDGIKGDPQLSGADKDFSERQQRKIASERRERNQNLDSSDGYESQDSDSDFSPNTNNPDMASTTRPKYGSSRRKAPKTARQLRDVKRLPVIQKKSSDPQNSLSSQKINYASLLASDPLAIAYKAGREDEAREQREKEQLSRRRQLRRSYTQDRDLRTYPEPDLTDRLRDFDLRPRYPVEERRVPYDSMEFKDRGIRDRYRDELQDPYPDLYSAGRRRSEFEGPSERFVPRSEVPLLPLQYRGSDFRARDGDTVERPAVLAPLPRRYSSAQSTWPAGW